MKSDVVAAMLVLTPASLALVNWLVSMIVVRNEPHMMVKDLRNLIPDSMPFVRTQWLFIVFSMSACGLSAISATLEGALPGTMPVSLILNGLAGFIIPVLGLFYVTYLASKKIPGLLATVGIWSLVKYSIASSLRTYISLVALLLFILPGMLFYIRTVLLLPIYICEGQRVGHSIKKSWTLTDGKYWRISRYLGIPLLLQLSLFFIPRVITTSTGIYGKGADGFSALLSGLPSLCMGLSVIVNLVVIGLSFKLYEKLNDPTTAGKTRALAEQ
jgi:hypothetical protein